MIILVCALAHDSPRETLILADGLSQKDNFKNIPGAPEVFLKYPQGSGGNFKNTLGAPGIF